MDKNLTEKQKKLLGKIEWFSIDVNCDINALKNGELNGCTIQDWIDALYNNAIGAANWAKDLYETTKENA